MRRILCLGLFAFVLVAAACGSDSGDGKSASKPDARATSPASTAVPAQTVSNAPVFDLTKPPKGAERLHFELGPIAVKPGQNNISYSTRGVGQPNEDGWIVGIQPNLRLADGSIPAVDVIHLHHGVWLNTSAKDATDPRLPQRFFAAGEEKTAMALPPGYGYQYKATDKWLINYMIHNLWPDPNQVWITYDIDFIPATSPAAQGIIPSRPIWMDVENGKTYPVFDVIQGSGQGGLYTYPDDATDPYKGQPPSSEWTVDQDGVLIGTAGHLHPGGLHDDLWLQRNGATALEGHGKVGAPDTARLFSSKADYFEPAGAVSWDVAMTATPADWRVQVHKGDVMKVSTTYDSKTASWYESMGIMVVWMADGATNGTDPFVKPVDVDGSLTHGHLAENNNHGGKPAPKDYVDLTKLPSQPTVDQIAIDNFVYARGDMSVADSVPTVAAGASITFSNLDAPLENGIWHTITACKAPCNKSTGIAYPRADGAVTFDSGELGTGGPPTAGRVTWQTPANLDPGTYTYFCRIHPFMRGAFRVVQP
jgi:plastocyanin